MKTLASYLILLLLAIDIVASCKKKDNSINASKYIAKMVGRRLWSGTYEYKFPPDTSVQIINEIDTPFVIEQNGNSAVHAFGLLLTCSGINDSTMTATFIYTDNNPNSTMNTNAALTYYFQSDSMDYRYGSYHHDLGSSTYLHTN